MEETQGPASRERGSSAWIDITVPVATGMVRWPDTPAVEVDRIKDVSRGDEYTLSALRMDSHTGTHMDAPRHFIASGKGIDEMPLEATVGPARVLEMGDPESIKPEALRPHRIAEGERILFKTANSNRRWVEEGFSREYVHLTLDAARYLADRRIRCVGMDYLSVAAFEHEAARTHITLLEAGIWIIEGLDLSEVSEGHYVLACLPLKIEKGDGAPARAALRPIPKP